MNERDNVKNYVLQDLMRGVDPEVLKSRLKAYGYDPSIVDETMAQKIGSAPGNASLPDDPGASGDGAEAQNPVTDSEFNKIGFFDKMSMVLFEPKKFFCLMPRSGGYLAPIAFSSFVIIIVNILNAMISMARGKPIEYAAGTVLSPIYQIFAATAVIFLISAPGYVALKLFNGRGTYQATVRVTAYAMAANIVVWIPFFGWLVSAYGLYIAGIGYSKIHQTSADNVLGAIMLIGFIVLIMMTIFTYLLWSGVSGILSNTVSLMGAGF